MGRSPDEIISGANTIAIVGCSDRPERTSNRIARYLQGAGFRIVPVNPNHESVLGEVCYPSVDAVPDDVVIDIVDIFRRPRFTADVVRDVIARRDRLGRSPVVWTQIGVSSEEARSLAADAGIEYVANRCTMVEHSRRLAREAN